MGLELTDEELDVAMAEMDVEGSGLVDFEELHTWWVNQDQDFGERLLDSLINGGGRGSGKVRVVLPDLNDPEVRRAGKVLTRAYSKRRLRKNAAEYRAEQLASLKSTPDWLARQCGWADAAEMADAQYESDVLDSKYGMGGGLEWGSERGPLATREGTFFSPVGRPARFADRRGLSEHMVNHALNSLSRSESYGALHAVTVAARFKKIVEHKRTQRAVEEARQISHARAREEEARQRRRAEESAIVYARILAARRAKMCKGWRLALPKVMLCARLMVDCRKRMALKQLERDKAEAVTEELAEIVEILRDSSQSVAEKAVSLGSMSLDHTEWEAAPVVRSMEYLGEGFTAGMEAQIRAQRRLASDGKSDREIRQMFDQLVVYDNYNTSASSASSAAAASAAAASGGGSSSSKGGGGAALSKEKVRELMVELFPGQSDEEFEAAFQEMQVIGTKQTHDGDDDDDAGDGSPVAKGGGGSSGDSDSDSGVLIEFDAFRDWWRLKMSSAKKAAAKQMREVQDRLLAGGDRSVDHDAGKADILALMDLLDPERGEEELGYSRHYAVAEAAVIMLAVGSNSDRHAPNAATNAGILRPRMVAKSVLVRHEHAEHLANHLMHLMNHVSCGSAVWDGLLSLLSFMVEGFFSVLVDPLTDPLAAHGVGFAFDRLFLPSDQKIVIDLLLRQPSYVEYSERRTWVVWLRCITGIVTTSHEYNRGLGGGGGGGSGGGGGGGGGGGTGVGSRRYRRLDLLDALSNLMAHGVGMGVEHAGLVAGCRQVLHNAYDEREMQRLIKAEHTKAEQAEAAKAAQEQQAAEQAAAVGKSKHKRSEA
jgi:hypothetical protein